MNNNVIHLTMQGETGLKYFFVSIIQSLTVYFIELYQDSDDFDQHQSIIIFNNKDRKNILFRYSLVL